MESPAPARPREFSTDFPLFSCRAGSMVHRAAPFMLAVLITSTSGGFAAEWLRLARSSPRPARPAAWCADAEFLFEAWPNAQGGCFPGPSRLTAAQAD